MLIRYFGEQRVEQGRRQSVTEFSGDEIFVEIETKFFVPECLEILRVNAGTFLQFFLNLFLAEMSS